MQTSLFIVQRMMLLCSLLFLLTSLAALQQDHVGQSWTLYKQPDGKTFLFKVFPISMDFWQAEANCQQFNAHLASFHSPVEFEFIKGLVENELATTNNHFWLGIYNKNESGQYLTNYKIYFVDGTNFVPWKTHQHYKVNSDPNTGFSNKLPIFPYLPETLYCMDYKTNRPGDESALMQPLEVSFEVTIQNLPCDWKLDAHVCKLPAEKAMPEIPSVQPTLVHSTMFLSNNIHEKISGGQNMVLTERTSSAIQPDFTTQSTLAKTTVVDVYPTNITSKKTYAVLSSQKTEKNDTPETQLFSQDGSMEIIVDQWEKNKDFPFYDVLFLLLICTVIAAVLVLLCLCHFVRRFSKGRYKTGTYYPSEPKTQPHILPTDYYIV